MSKNAERLHHLSMRYSGAFKELADGKPLVALPQGHPGLREMRDLIDLILITRAEINGLTKILVEADLVTVGRVAEVMDEEYAWLTGVKARFLGVDVTDEGLTFRAGTGKHVSSTDEN